MKSKILWVTISLLMVLSLVLISCSDKTTTTQSVLTSTTTSSSAVTSSQATTSVPPSTTPSNWWDKFGEPTYGGTLVMRTNFLDNVSFANTQPMGGEVALWYERLFVADWTVDRDKWPFTVNYLPEEYWTDWLAEGWEKTDPLTYTVHLHQGIHWQNKPPVNGRELVAEDVQHHYDSVLGTGSGFTKPSPFFAGMIPNVERVVAVDKYTVQFKFKTPSVFNLAQVLGDYGGGETPIEAPEVVQAYSSDASDVRNAVGTGAWMFTDFVRGTSITLDKNPDYWGYDQRHPKNKVPYIDAIKLIAIPDDSTAVAAMRSGKFDMCFGGGFRSWQLVQSLIQTNPEIQAHFTPAFTTLIDFRCDRSPFTDIKVRKALQMAIDSDAIAKSIYGGLVDGTITGVLETPGWALKYDQWPADLQQEYVFNPSKAKELLAEAGYPNGFTTNIVSASGNQEEFLQTIKSYLADIGVEMDINLMERSAYMPYVMAGKQDQMSVEGNIPPAPSISVMRRVSTSPENSTFNKDTHYDDLVNQFQSSATMDEAKSIYQEMQIYTLQQHWSLIAGPAVGIFGTWNSYIKGFSGESMVGVQGAFYYARFWIDQDLKTSLGR